MGADLTIAAARWPTSENGVQYRLPDPVVSEMIYQRMSKLPEEEFDPFHENGYGWLWKQIETVLVGLPAFARDLVVLKLDHQQWIVSGGMTWGDPPTDSYDGVWILSLLTDDLFTAEEYTYAENLVRERA